MRKNLFNIALFSLVFLLWTEIGQAQDTQDPNNNKVKSKNEFLPEGRFFADISKDFAHGPFQIVYSWEANIGFKTIFYRHSRNSLGFEFDVQTAGAPPSGRRINIAGTSYILGPSYIYKLNENTTFSLGVTHLSSHITEDALKITAQEKREGITIPPVKFDDLNVGYLEVAHSFAFKQLEPSFRFRFQPLGIKFRGGYNFYKEPVFMSTQFRLWKRRSSNLLFITRHEFGNRSFSDGILRLDLLKPSKKDEGRFQLAFSYSPGEGLWASPNVGWHKQGFSTTMRFVFLAH